MAEDIYLKLESPAVDGDTTVKGHEKQLALLSWSWNASQSASMHEATGGGAGKSSFGDLSCFMKADTASVTLLQFLAKGTHIGKGTLIQRKAGDKQLDFVTLVIEEIIVSSISMSGAADDCTVSFTLNFAKFEYKFAAQDAKTGGKGKEPSFKYDIAKVDAA